MMCFLGTLFVVYLFGMGALLITGAIIFGTADTDRERNDGAAIARVAFYWPVWVASYMVKVLTWAWRTDQ